MIKVAQPYVGEEEVEAISRVVLSGEYVSGRQVLAFEKLFAEFIGTEHAVAVNSGTAALHTLLAALNVGPGDEVIVPPMTFFSTVSAVLHQRATPIFADIDKDSYCLNPDSVRHAISPRTKAVIAVHLFGQAARIDSIRSFCDEHGIFVLEDCAQSHGTTLGGLTTGGLATAGAFSFFATKHMTTAEGGMITTNDPELAARCRLIRSHGMTDRDTHELLGYNYRMNEIAAAMGLVQLGRLADLNRRRIENSLYLVENLAGLGWVQPPVLFPGVEHTFFWAAFRVNEEKLGYPTTELVAKLREAGVEVRHRYRAPLYKQPILQTLLDDSRYPMVSRELNYAELNLANVEAVAGKLIGLPNHPGLSRQELDMVLDTFRHLRT